MTGRAWPFGSFFLGGFEGSSLRARDGSWLDLVVATGHDVQARKDYALCRALGIRAVREVARWPTIDRGGSLRLEDVSRLVRLGREAGLVQIWDLMHYGYPEDLDPFSAAFVDRFAAYAAAVARLVREESEGPISFTPINEPSFTAWAADVGHMAPFSPGRGMEYKRQLVRAQIAGAESIWRVDPDARIVTVDPLVRQHTPPDRPDLAAEVEHFNRLGATHGFDLLAGRSEPELGGARKYLGTLGIVYYPDNQWVYSPVGAPARVLKRDDLSYVPLSDLLLELHARYGGPLLIAETGSHAGARADWISYVAREAERARERGVDLQGVCLYPFVSSPDWEETTASFDAGVLDVVHRPDGRQERILTRSVGETLRAIQARLDPANLPPEPLPYAELGRPIAVPPPIDPLAAARYRPAAFSYQRLLVGESLMVELYCFEAHARLHPHRHDETEHVLTIVAGQAQIEIGEERTTLRQGQTMLVPAGAYHGVRNEGAEPLIVQQVSAPKPWDARLGGRPRSQSRTLDTSRSACDETVLD